MPDDLTKIAIGLRSRRGENESDGADEGINFFSGFEQKPFEVEDVTAIQESTKQPLFKEKEPEELSRVEQTIRSVFDKAASGIDNVLEGKATLGGIDLATSILELRFLPFTVPLAFFGDVSQVAGEQIGGQMGEAVQTPSKVVDWLFSLPAQGFRGAMELGLQGLEDQGVDTDDLKNSVVLFLKATGKLAPDVEPEVFYDKLGDLGDIAATLGTFRAVHAGGKKVIKTLTKKKPFSADIDAQVRESLRPEKGIKLKKESEDGTTRTQPKTKVEDKGTKEKIETEAEVQEKEVKSKEVEDFIKEATEDVTDVGKSPIQETTSIKNEVVNRERLERGIEPLETVGKRQWGKVWGEAKNKIESGKINPRKLANELKENPRPTTDTENAILDYDRVTLNNQFKKLTGEITGKDVKKDAIAKAELLKVEEALNENDIASRTTGTETARALAIRKMMVRDDYTLAEIVQSARNANGGKVISGDLKVKFTRLTNEIEVANKKLLAYEDRIANLQATRTFKNIQKEARKTKRQVRKGDIDAEYNGLIKEFASISQLNVLVDPKQVALMLKMAKNRVKAGANTIEGLVDDIYSATRDFIKDLTKRDVRDAISGYGRFSPLTKNEITLQLADLKKQGRIVSALEDIQRKVKPLKSGFERQRLSKEAQKLQKQLDQEIGDSPLVTIFIEVVEIAVLI